MTRQSVLKFVVSGVAGFLFLIAIRNVYGGRVWAYMEGHFWLVCFLPLMSLFLVLLALGLYKQYAQEPDEQTAHE